MNAEKNIEELIAAAAGRTAEIREWAADIVIFGRRMIVQSTSSVYRMARGCARWQISAHLQTLLMQGPIVHQPEGRMWDTRWRGRHAGS